MATVMVVDDGAQDRRVVEAVVRYHGHDVLLAGNANQALLLVKENSPEIVVSDVRMPGMDGFELVTHLRELGTLDSTYIILLTSDERPATKLKGLAVGADDFVLKPVHPDEFGARLRLGVQVRRLRVESHELRSRLTRESLTRSDLEGTLQRLGSLRTQLADQLAAILETAREARSACSDGSLRHARDRIENLVILADALYHRVKPKD